MYVFGRFWTLGPDLRGRERVMNIFSYGLSPKRHFPKTVFYCLIIALFLNGCARVPKHSVSTPYVPSPTFQRGLTHMVERGETLYRIAKNYNVEMSALMRVNHIYNPTQLEVGQPLFIPQAVAPPTVFRPYEPVSLEEVRRIVGPRIPGSDWRTITVHHSGTMQGSASLFDRDHRRRHMGGLFYHFVIGNGTKTPEGLIEVEANRPYDIQICLVGNFDEQDLSEGEFSSLVNLIRVLQEEYHIPKSAIRKHCDIKGRHTECPGSRFPFSRLISTLS